MWGLIFTLKRWSTDLYLSYDGKLGIDTLVNAAISFVKKFVPEKTSFGATCLRSDGWKGRNSLSKVKTSGMVLIAWLMVRG